MQKIVLLICAAFLALAQNCLAADYRYVSADELKGWLEAAKPVLLVDIQVEKEFAPPTISRGRWRPTPIRSSRMPNGGPLTLRSAKRAAMKPWLSSVRAARAARNGPMGSLKN